MLPKLRGHKVLFLEKSLLLTLGQAFNLTSFRAFVSLNLIQLDLRLDDNLQAEIDVELTLTCELGLNGKLMMSCESGFIC